MNTIPETHQDLLTDDKKAFLYLATIMKDGTPQVTPVWFNTDDTHILINSAEGRLKDKNMRARPAVAVVIADPANPYRYLQIRGKIVEITLEGAEEHIDKLAFKYQGVPTYPYRRADEKRVIYKILPEKVDAH
jgi:PPOX class probable F420-dependent enzyme